MRQPTGTYLNDAARSWRAEPLASIRSFHASLPGYAPTQLVEVQGLARQLGVARVFVKQENQRLGLPAFKILGASYAVARALSARYGHERTLSLGELRGEVAAHGPVELVAATDGNHGRAVAHMARLLGLPARIFYPGIIADAAKAGIASEGATAIECELNYDEVVAAAARAANEAGEGAILIQDTSWTGYEQIPQYIVDGYSTLFEEADEQLAAAGIDRVDLVAVPVGVGSLAQAAVRHYRSRRSAPRVADAPTGVSAPTVLSVEAVNAPSIIASLHAGRAITVKTAPTIMAGLNCGTPSALAWPLLVAGVDAAVAVTDEAAARAVNDLRSAGVDSGPCGAATLAGVRALAAVTPLAPDAVLLLISTEGRAANPGADSSREVAAR